MDRTGFTLVEALVAMLLSTLVVAMVASVFLVQNEFYSYAVKKSALHESVRGATALVSTQLWGVSKGGIVEAESDSLTYRVPLVVGGVCAVNATETYLLLPLDGQGVPASDVSGYAIRDDTGVWTYTPSSWGSIFQASGAVPASTCALAGADTTEATADFYRLDGLVASPPLEAGDLVMIYRQMTLKLAPSGLDGGSSALFVGVAGDTLAEFASGLTLSSAFEYRFANQDLWRDRVPGEDVFQIGAIRFSALGAAASARVGRDSITFNLTVTVPLGHGN